MKHILARDQKADDLAASWINGNLSLIRAELKGDPSMTAMVALALRHDYSNKQCWRFLAHLASNPNWWDA
jgi:hypothetical protein